MIKKLMIMVAFVLAMGTNASAQIALDSVSRNPEYVGKIIGRAQKIVDDLKIKDKSVKQNVLNIIANRYFKLNDIDDKYKADKNALQAELYKHHFEFAADLANYLNEKQIDAVKDGMTFGVLPKTYQAHLEMIPSLKENEKLQILNWLKEAREFAMDAGSSKEKHGWFGKYKGRINNWLSKQGYDLVKEREGWYKRIEKKKKKEAKKKK